MTLVSPPIPILGTDSRGEDSSPGTETVEAMNPLVVLGVCFGPLVLVVSYLFTAATGPSVPPWADAAGQAIRLYGTVAAVVVGPLALHADRLDLARESDWVPSPVYYLIAVPFLSIPIAFIYLVRRLTAA
ncbi:hypothetical protein C452_08173 [Haloferax volcanii JCM 10717]|nr:hypothetical protein [Haloferax sp. BAB-2207]ELK49996.1 hypothetical protein D320_17750 [Haloferax sp. BAB-2207]ELZ70601.1 hypothetical protein C456_15562 [Haloferax lucentense DSM 14919]ELZ92579.1 hypothetical protein C452_08173 [Haloferax alexandrinus JCM 10717]